MNQLFPGVKTTPSISPTVAQAVQAARQRLAAALPWLTPAEARLEANVLAARALGVDRAWLVAHDRDVLAPAQAAAVEAFVARRLAGEPVAYILGEREFFGRAFTVTPDVLIPRPETEHLVEAALERFPADRSIAVLDIGTGSGCIAITLKLERPAWQVTAVDVSPAALVVARRNAERLGAEVTFLESDLFSALDGRRFGLIVSNPPYVAEADDHLRQGDARFEPVGALASGPEGLNAARRIVEQARDHLNPDGWLMLEHGYDQGASCRQMMRLAGYAGVETRSDLADLDRIAVGCWRHS
jgi:release factor glutamine methyltransferase